MYIGELARRTGASPRAIRLYERMGLLSVTRSGTYRVYNNDHLEFVLLIKEAQRLGVSLSEIRLLQQKNDGISERPISSTVKSSRDGSFQDKRKSAGDIDWTALNDLLSQKKQQAEAEIVSLQQFIERVDRYQTVIADCVEQGLDKCDPPDQD